ncbi:pre-mycofactocin synthase MftD [Nocardia sp. NPDC088792]|uniref:pre-mycofactocin synthase MftD n=1 Tax=Nocardia sp. NPDC088792 TaxID=3364332 RepID=UPI0037F409F1
MANPWFETVAEAQRRAERRLPKSVYGALIAGSEAGVTLKDNIAAFGELGFAPHLVGQTADRDLSTTVMGQRIALPVIISPVGAQAIHPDGEVAVARAAAARGTLVGLSSFAGKSVEEVAAANPRTLLQIYWSGNKDQLIQRMERARAAGVVGLIVTLDWSFSHGRDWGSPAIPERVDLKALIQYGPQALTHPRWLARFVKSGRIPDLTVPNMGIPGRPAPTFFEAYGEWMQTPPPTWDDLRWLVEQWGGPVMLKGIMRIDDARRAVDTGATALSVSNHGGNNLDTTPASIRALAPVVDAVGGEIEIVLDGGVRRGSDVVKALALGARAVMIGRAYLWGLASAGQPGVENVLDILSGGIDSALRGLGRSSVRELTRADVVMPPGFGRKLGKD